MKCLSFRIQCLYSGSNGDAIYSFLQWNNNDLEFPEGYCEVNYTLVQWHIDSLVKFSWFLRASWFVGLPPLLHAWRLVSALRSALGNLCWLDGSIWRFDSMVRLFDCSMLTASLVLVAVAGLCSVNYCGRFACWFRKVVVWLWCFIWGPTRSSSGGIGGFSKL